MWLKLLKFNSYIHALIKIKIKSLMIQKRYEVEFTGLTFFLIKEQMKCAMFRL